MSFSSRRFFQKTTKVKIPSEMKPPLHENDGSMILNFQVLLSHPSQKRVFFLFKGLFLTLKDPEDYWNRTKNGAQRELEYDFLMECQQ